MPMDTKIILQQSKLFKHLTSADIEGLAVEAVSREYQANDVIVKEGDIGDLLYIIISGSVRVYTRNAKNEIIVLARLEAGDYFGEQALLTAIPTRRNATVSALTNVNVITFTHATLQRCLKLNQSLVDLLQAYGQRQLLDKLEAQLQVHQSEKIKLFDLFEKAADYAPRQIIFFQDDPANYAYYLLSGSVEIRIYDNDLKLQLRNNVLPGQFFGERGVIKNTKRAGTAVAITDVRLVAINANTLQNAYDSNQNIKELLSNLMRVYDIPAHGLMTQFRGEFLGQTAIHTNIKKPDGEVITASCPINSNILAICYASNTQAKTLIFRDSDQHVREIQLVNDRLVGVLSIGEWGDLSDIYQNIYSKSIVDVEAQKTFAKSGRLELKSEFTCFGKDVVCTCMQVKFERVQQVILGGALQLTDISRETGAGTVCGGCVPRIKEMLGLDAWSYVKLTHVYPHNKTVRSFRFQLVNKVIPPYQPGQYIVIEAEIDGMWVSRSYTLTSIPENNFYEITVKREPLGLFSRWLFDKANLGSVFRVSDPQGNFVLPQDNALPIVCFVGGIGITPAIAFAKKNSLQQYGQYLHIDYSVTQSEEVAFKHELRNWIKLQDKFSLNLRITSETSRITAKDIDEIFEQYPDAEFYICGSESFQKAVTAYLNEKNVTATHIHIEEFTHAGEPIGLH